MITLLKEQSASILSDKISEICKLIPAFQKEILWDTRGMTNAKTRQTKDSVVYTFKNGSVIENVACSDKTRGRRFQAGLTTIHQLSLINSLNCWKLFRAVYTTT